MTTITKIYTTEYNTIIKPRNIWSTSKYFLRRWGPYLGPRNFWLVIAAQQKAYRNNRANWFDAYDSQLAAVSGSGVASVRRAKATLKTIARKEIKAGTLHQLAQTKMSQAQSPLGLFLTKREVEYQLVGGIPKPQTTHYFARSDTPLTPADARHLARWFQEQSTSRQAKDVMAVLEAAQALTRNNLTSSTLLAPTNLQTPLFTPHFERPAMYRANTVIDVVNEVYGPGVSKNPEVRATADVVHLALTGRDHQGKNYFVREWLPILKPGAAFLFEYLRSWCYERKDGGNIIERRDEISFTRPALADVLGVSTKTLGRWLSSLEKAAPQQAAPPLIEKVGLVRTGANDRVFTFKIAGFPVLPLISPDLNEYNAAIKAQGQIDSHAPPSNKPQAGESQGQNDSHVPQTNEPKVIEPQGQNDSHGARLKDKMIEAQGQNDSHGARLRDKKITAQGQIDSLYKYYKDLLLVLLEIEVEEAEILKGLKSFATAAAFWKPEKASLPFPQAAVGTIEGLLDALTIAGKTRQTILSRGKLDLPDMTAWYVYALTQPNLVKKDMVVGYVANRLREGAAPPEPFESFMTLSWSEWRTLAAINQFRTCLWSESIRKLTQQIPQHGKWMQVYQDISPKELPFGVGAGWDELESFLMRRERTQQSELGEIRLSSSANKNGKNEMIAAITWGSPTEQQTTWWKVTLTELELQMTRATFNTWLKDARLLGVNNADNGDGHQYVIGVRNEYAKDWLENRLEDTIQRTLAAITNTPVLLRFEVWVD
ncbi:MAG: hypothetical protein GY805_18185 [Chloroflexi bacterium]|nr:hypothetical protein [Chloroflexota bacterium]